MNEMRKTDLRIIKTRQAIKEAFTQMIMEMDAHKITVKELAERASINRKTFYLHYTCIEALFEDVLQDMSDAYAKVIDQVPLPMSMKDVNRVFFTHLARQEEFVEQMFTAPGYRDFTQKLLLKNLKHNRERYNPYKHLSQAKQNIVNTFLITSSLDMYRQWIADGKKVPLEEVIELSGELLSHGVESIIHTK